jgi:hypothetical protein
MTPPRGVVLVAGAEAAWVERTTALLAARGYAVARLSTLADGGMLVVLAGGVMGLIVDATRPVDEGGPLAQLRAARRIRILAVDSEGPTASDLDRLFPPLEP